MDRITCLAYLLYQTDNEKVKRAAVDLFMGDISVKELKKDIIIKPHIQTAENLLKKTRLNKREVIRFVEENIYAH